MARRMLVKNDQTSTQRLSEGKAKDLPSGRLLDIHHVRNKSETLELQPGNIGLQQDIDFGSGFLHTFLYRDRDTLQELAQLQLLLLTDGKELELLREGKNTKELNGSHGGSKMLVVSSHGIVRHIEMRSDASKIGALKLPRGSLVLDKVALLKEGGSSVYDISALLDESAVLILVIDAYAVQNRILEHAYVTVE